MTCLYQITFSPRSASTLVIPRYRQIIRKRAVPMLAIALAMMASLMVDVTCGSSLTAQCVVWRRAFPAGKGECKYAARYCLGYSLPYAPDGPTGGHGVRVSGRRNAKPF